MIVRFRIELYISDSECNSCNSACDDNGAEEDGSHWVQVTVEEGVDLITEPLGGGIRVSFVDLSRFCSLVWNQ